MNILGIDPGTGRTGWGVIKISNIKYQKSKIENNGVGVEYVAHGCVVTDQEDLMEKRLLTLYRSINKIIKSYSPDCIVIEQIFFGKNSKTAMSVGQARGVVMLSSARFNLPLFEYTSITVKHALTGNGRSDKKDMQKTVRKLLNQTKRTLSFNAKDKGFDDSADALAIALYHATVNTS